jgi:hypothetical protein
MPRRIYILNLPYKPDRRERLAAHLAELELFPAERIRWVQGGVKFEMGLVGRGWVGERASTEPCDPGLVRRGGTPTGFCVILLGTGGAASGSRHAPAKSRHPSGMIGARRVVGGGFWGEGRAGAQPYRELVGRGRLGVRGWIWLGEWWWGSGVA